MTYWMYISLAMTVISAFFAGWFAHETYECRKQREEQNED